MQYQEIQIRSKSAIVYTAYANPGNSGRFSSAAEIEAKLAAMANKKNDQPVKEAVKVTYSGKMTIGARKRLTKAISLLVQSTKQHYIYNPVTQRKQLFQLSFLTLTISSKNNLLTAKEAYDKLLAPFLLYLRRHHQVNNYVWKAELQKRGQIHYHITLDQFVLYTDIRDKWNNLQNQHGLLDDYKMLNTGREANSTDVHAVRKVKNIEAYMVKYMSKDNADDVGTVGKVWDCSINLKKAKYFSTSLTYGIERTINYVVDSKQGEVFHFDHFSIIKLKELNASYLLEENAKYNYEMFLNTISNKNLLPLAALGGAG
jgi:hypothetical protein